jgi:multicomponent Na+:H+ antiporter subunit D
MNHLVILPFIIPLTAAAVGVMMHKHWRAQAAWSLGAMLTSSITTYYLLLTVYTTGQPIVFQMGGWSAPFGISIMGDVLSATMATMVQTVMTFGMVYALGAKDSAVRYPTFLPLFLMLCAGLTGGMLTGDIFNLFVMVELIVITAIALTAISDDRYGAEAAYKYLYICIIASTTLLLAIGCLYIGYGTLNMADLAARIAANPEQPTLWLGIVFLFITFCIKSAAFPFHFWQPDFHTAAPTPVSAMLSSVVVKLGVYGFIRMTTLLFVEQAATIQSLLVLLGVAGVLYGGFGALGTHNAKRMLAYSTLAQVGFMLVGIGWGTPLSLAAAIVFIINHSLIKSAMLMLAGYIASRAPVKSAAFDAVQGVGKYTPVAGVLFFLGGMALAGIPPMNGFISKLALFRSGIAVGMTNGADHFVSLLLIGVPSLITLVYVMRAFMKMWWEPRHNDEKVKPYGDSLLAPIGLIALCLALGVFGESLVQLATSAANWVLAPAQYIQAVLVR